MNTPTREELLAAARRLYDECPTVKLTWDQLGDVTRGVWIERAQQQLSSTVSQDKDES